MAPRVAGAFAWQTAWLVVVPQRSARIDVHETFALQIRRRQNQVPMRRQRIVGRTGSLTTDAITGDGRFNAAVVLPEIALMKLNVLGSEGDFDAHAPDRTAVG